MFQRFVDITSAFDIRTECKSCSYICYCLIDTKYNKFSNIIIILRSLQFAAIALVRIFACYAR